MNLLNKALRFLLTMTIAVCMSAVIRPLHVSAQKEIYPSGSIVVTKKGSDGKEYLGGAVFRVDWLFEGDDEGLPCAYHPLGEIITKEGEPAVFENAGAGKFRLVETKAPEGYALAKPVEFEVKEVPDPEDETKMIELGLVTVTDQAIGDLTIRKAVTGLNETDQKDNADKEYAFTIQDEKGMYLDAEGTASSKEVLLKLHDNESLQLKSIPIGTYTVTEKGTEVNGDALIDGYLLDAKGSGKVEVKKGQNTDVTLSNTYQEQGSLTFTKTITGDVNEEDLSKLVFTVQNTDTETVIGTYHLSDLEKGEDGVYTKTLYGLVPGNYMVMESNGDVAHYTLSDQDSIMKGTVEVKGGDPARIDLKNTYEKNPGKLTFTKSFHGVEEKDLKDIVFTVTNEDIDKVVGTWHLSDLEKISDHKFGMSLEVEPGTYTVIESHEEIKGCTVEKKYSVKDGRVIVESDQEAVVDIDDTYRPEKPKTPDTGDRTDLLLYALLGAGALSVTALLWNFRRKYSR